MGTSDLVLDLAAALAERDLDGDINRAAALLTAAIDAGCAVRLDRRVLRWSAALAELPVPDAGGRGAAWVRHGDRWDVAGCGERAIVEHTVGMTYLAALLASPGAEIAAGALAGVELVQSRQDVLDGSALEALRRRLTELERAIDAATVAGRLVDALRLQAEFDTVLSHTRSVARLGGRSRTFDDAAERARTSVQKAIRRAVRNVAAAAPLLGAALEGSLRTGYRCSYQPVDGAPDRWVVRVNGAQSDAHDAL